AQAVQVVAVIRLQSQGLLQEGYGFLQFDPLISVGIADIVIGLSVLGVDLDDFGKLPDSFVLAAELLVSDSKLEMRGLVLRRELDGPLQRRHGLLIIFDRAVGQPQEQGDLGVVGEELSAPGKYIHGLVGPALPVVKHAELEVSLSGLGVFLQDRQEYLLGLG